MCAPSTQRDLHVGLVVGIYAMPNNHHELSLFLRRMFTFCEHYTYVLFRNLHIVHKRTCFSSEEVNENSLI